MHTITKVTIHDGEICCEYVKEIYPSEEGADSTRYSHLVLSSLNEDNFKL